MAHRHDIADRNEIGLVESLHVRDMTSMNFSSYRLDGRVAQVRAELFGGERCGAAWDRGCDFLHTIYLSIAVFPSRWGGRAWRYDLTSPMWPWRLSAATGGL